MVAFSGSARQIIVLIHQIEADIFKYGIWASMPLLEYLALIDSPWVDAEPHEGHIMLALFVVLLHAELGVA